MTRKKTVKIFEIVSYKDFKTIDDLPEPTVPYFIQAKDGNFLHRRTAIGDIIARDYSSISRFLDVSEIGNGQFTWKGPKIPGKIIAQATAWFRHIYDLYHSEAEVILTKKVDTDEWRIFVPYQRASGGGVHSIFDPTHIERNWLVVGTIHSHCNMNAFHSGTDSGDAAKMDGVHFTIGKISSPVPEIVCMVAMSAKEYHFKDPAAVAELDFDGQTVPAWWDNMMLHNPVDKPKGLVSITDGQWNEFLGHSTYEVKKSTYNPSAVVVHHPRRTPNDWSDRHDWEPGMWRNATPRKWDGESRSWVPVPSEEHDWSRFNRGPAQLDSDSRNFNETRRERRKRLRAEEKRLISELIGYEDHLPGFGIRKVSDVNGRGVDLAIDIAVTGELISDADMGGLTSETVSKPEFWMSFFQKKIDIAVEALAALGMNTDYTISPFKFDRQKGSHK